MGDLKNPRSGKHGKRSENLSGGSFVKCHGNPNQTHVRICENTIFWYTFWRGSFVNYQEDQKKTREKRFEKYIIFVHFWRRPPGTIRPPHPPYNGAVHCRFIRGTS